MKTSTQIEAIFLALLIAGLGAVPAFGWTSTTQVAIGDNASSISPPDLARQIERHREEFRRGILAPFQATPQTAHVKNPGGDGNLDTSITRAVEGAIAAIEDHRPFPEIAYRIGVVAHYVADANNPLNSSDEDRAEDTYFVDYLRYVETSRKRFPIVFYGEGRDLASAGDLALLLHASLERGRSLYPMIGQEYERIGRIDGAALFDDRSTAFGVGSIAISHAVSDVAAVMRYIWLEAGGGDRRRLNLTRPGSPQAARRRDALSANSR